MVCKNKNLSILSKNYCELMKLWIFVFQAKIKEPTDSTKP